jgi:hypothetical protein
MNELHNGNDSELPSEALPAADAAVAESLQSALRDLRDNAEQLEKMPLDDAKIDAASKMADEAAQIDDQIGSIARGDN